MPWVVVADEIDLDEVPASFPKVQSLDLRWLRGVGMLYYGGAGLGRWHLFE